MLPVAGRQQTALCEVHLGELEGAAGAEPAARRAPTPAARTLRRVSSGPWRTVLSNSQSRTEAHTPPAWHPAQPPVEPAGVGTVSGAEPQAPFTRPQPRRPRRRPLPGDGEPVSHPLPVIIPWGDLAAPVLLLPEGTVPAALVLPVALSLVIIALATLAPDLDHAGAAEPPAARPDPHGVVVVQRRRRALGAVGVSRGGGAGRAKVV